MSETKSLAIVNKQISEELKDPNIARALLATTFKGLKEPVMKQAIFEGILRGFTFKEFLAKDIYAIPFKDGYALVGSIDKARKIGAKSGVVGVTKPTYVMDGKKIVSCEITVKKLIGTHIGDFTAEVFFDEYYKEGRNGYPSMWDSKPRTMISKVAEMHALRKACPEELSKMYTEEELQKEEDADYDRSEIDDDAVPTIHIGDDHGIPPPNQMLDKPKVDFSEDALAEQEKDNGKK